MVAEIIKYKHYLLIIAALILANYVVVPLDEWQTEQQQSLQLLNKQYNKTQSLLNNKDQLAAQLVKSQANLAKVEKIIFVNSSEDKFKLMVQSLIEKELSVGECQIERIGFKGSIEVSADIQRWTMEVRFNGDINCMTTATRKVESLSPHLKITGFNFNHRGLTQEVTGKFNAQINIDAWYLEERQ
jgi:hypothetical protein